MASDVPSTRASAARSRRGLVVFAAACVAVAALGGGGAAGAPGQTQATEITVNFIPIANTFPLDLGIKKGFFDAQGLTIKKVALASGNDVMLALANHQGDVGFAGWVPAFIARTNGIPVTTLTASEVEGTSEADNWQNILVKGSSSIRTPAELLGKTIAVNALKGVGEIMIRAAFEKSGLDQTALKLVAVPFPAMRTALANGQVDAIWTPEPFLTQAMTIDGARIVMAPGPVLGRYFPIGGYFARQDWVAANQGLAGKFQKAMNQSLTYAQGHPDEIREFLPATAKNVRLPIWTTLVDRAQLLTLAKYSKKYGVITSLPNFTQLVPSTIEGGKTLQGTVGNKFITLRKDGVIVTELKHGNYTFVVTDNSKTQNFQLVGPGVNRKTSVAGTGRVTWGLTLKKGKYTYSSKGRPAVKRPVAVT